MKKIHLPIKKPAVAYHPKSTVTRNENPTMVQLKQLRQQEPVQFQQHILALQNTLGSQSVVQLLHQLETPPSQEIVHHKAAKGVQGSGVRLPHYDKIQRSFGRHDISRVQAYTGKQSAAANAAIGAKAYATGNKIAFAESKPDLHTAAHEAAHVIQQQSGVQLKGGVGKSGDKYERHADKVADLVVHGKSAQAALDTMADKGSATTGSQSNVQAMVKTTIANHFGSSLEEMIELLKTGPIFIGESHDKEEGSDIVLKLIELDKVDKIFLELPPFRTEQASVHDEAVVINPIKTMDEYQKVKYMYTDLIYMSNFYTGTTAKRYSRITEFALQKGVIVYHADTDFLDFSAPKDKKNYDVKERNEFTSKYISDNIGENKGPRTLVLGGAKHYTVKEDVPIHNQLGYGNEKNQHSRFFNLGGKE